MAVGPLRVRVHVTAPSADAAAEVQREDFAQAPALSQQDEDAVVEAMAQALAGEYRRRKQLERPRVG